MFWPTGLSIVVILWSKVAAVFFCLAESPCSFSSPFSHSQSVSRQIEGHIRAYISKLTNKVQYRRAEWLLGLDIDDGSAHSAVLHQISTLDCRDDFLAIRASLTE